MQVIRLYYVSTGQFGKVYKAKMMGSQQSVTVAVKTVAHNTLDFRKEVTIMSEVVHPNIIHLYGLINQGRFEKFLFSALNVLRIYSVWHNHFQVKWHQQW